MASIFKIIKPYLLRFSGIVLTAFSLAYSFLMWQVLSPILTLPVYITSPLVCIASLPLSGVFLWFLKNGKSKLKAVLFLYALPSLIPWICAGIVYIYSSFLGGEFFSSLVIYTTSIGWGITALCLIFASAVTLLLFGALRNKNGKR